MSHVFISYNRQETDYVEQLTAHIQAHQFSVWWDRHLETGDKWQEELSIAIQTSSVVIVLMSEAGQESDWVKREVALAIKMDCRILPLLLSGKPFEDLKPYQHLPVSQDRMPGEEFFERLRTFARPNSSYVIDALVDKLEQEKGFQKQARSQYMARIEPAYTGIRSQSWSLDINAISLILADSLSPSQMQNVHDDYFAYLRNWKPSFFGERLIKKRGILGFVFENPVSQDILDIVRKLVRDSEQSGLHLLDGVRTVSWAISLDLARVEGQFVMLEVLPPAIADFYPGRKWLQASLPELIEKYAEARKRFAKGI